ncbi:MAG: hypothetical protein WBC01_02795, partial [Solirubrobacterales bacterium]
SPRGCSEAGLALINRQFSSAHERGQGQADVFSRKRAEPECPWVLCHSRVHKPGYLFPAVGV